MQSYRGKTDRECIIHYHSQQEQSTKQAGGRGLSKGILPGLYSRGANDSRQWGTGSKSKQEMS